MMALAALCIVGMASAVTVSWKVGTTAFLGPSSGEWVATAVFAGAVTDFSAVEVVEGSYQLVNGGSVEVTVSATDASNNVRQIASDMHTYNNESDAAVNSVQGAVTITSDKVDALKSAGSLTIVFASPYYQSVSNSGYMSCAVVDLTGWDGVSDIALTFGEIDLRSDTGANGFNAGAEGNMAVALPEPTALALLVLGVAGMALRRRAA